jgi:5-methylcytosine-specific restriction endonuclease McrA
LLIKQGKVCSQCKEWKVYEKFGIKNSEKDGHRASCKECQKRYKQANKDRITKYQKEYFQKNKENAREYYRKYYHSNKEKYGKYRSKEIISERNKRYYRATAEKHAEWSKEYYRVNKEKIIKYQQEYQSKPENRKKISERVRKYSQTEKGKATAYKKRIKRRSSEHHVKFTPHDRSQLLERDNWTCQLCGIKVHDESKGNWNTPNKCNIDHIIPISKGGNSTPDNLQILCRTCNLSKSDNNTKDQTS